MCLGSVTTITRNCVQSILTKLGLYVKVVTISSWLNFVGPAPSGRGSAAGHKFLAPLYYSQRAVFASLSGFFIKYGQLTFFSKFQYKPGRQASE